ncbi:MAG: outer membrane lipoprotein chaperone LolA [Nitrospinae bacterium]|nr:outer membrane lipoprotein chaperone LolA [Nitrospinota bacterium]
MNTQLRQYILPSIVGLVFLLLLFFVPTLSAAPDSLDNFVNAIQKQYELNKTLTGNFTQVAYLKQHNRQNISKGKAYLKKPGRMRWEYKEPEEQVIVSDGNTLWFYLPLDGQATKSKLSEAVAPDSPYNFLMGKGKIRQLFEISSVTLEWGDAKLRYLSLVPKRGELNMAKIIIGVNRKTFQVEETNVIDYFGNSTRVIMSEVDRESDIPDTMFNFVPPKNVEVIEDNRD